MKLRRQNKYLQNLFEIDNPIMKGGTDEDDNAALIISTAIVGIVDSDKTSSVAPVGSDVPVAPDLSLANEQQESIDSIRKLIEEFNKSGNVKKYPIIEFIEEINNFTNKWMKPIPIVRGVVINNNVNSEPDKKSELEKPEPDKPTIGKDCKDDTEIKGQNFDIKIINTVTEYVNKNKPPLE